MPWNEQTTSLQDAAYDAEGNYHVSRRFRVWGVDPIVATQAPATITKGTGATPSITLPDFNHELGITTGPVQFTGGIVNGVSLKVYLYEYLAQPVMEPNAGVFDLVARYTNDTRRAPSGQVYQSEQLNSLVPIPYARVFYTLTSGATNSTGLPYSFVESSINAPMPVARISQTVSIRRKQRGQAWTKIIDAANAVHELTPGFIARFDGASFRQRSVQWLDVTYTWSWEAGVKHLSTVADYVVNRQGDQVPAEMYYPPPITPRANIGTELPFILPPYHTIELIYTLSLDAFREPVWSYRFPHVLQTDQHNTGAKWQSLIGSERFEWSQW